MTRLTLATLCLLLIGGCGYRTVTNSGNYRDDVRTIAISAAASARSDLDVPGELSAAVVRAVEARTPFRSAPPSEADTLLEVVITSYGIGTGRRSNETRLPLQQSAGVRADVTWTDLRTGETLLELGDVYGRGELFPTLGEGRPIARRDAAEALAQAIADELAARW